MKKRKLTGHTTSKIVVFPHAIAATEAELLTFLKREQWTEATELLDWLLSLPDQPAQKQEEWSILREAMPATKKIQNDFDLDENQLFAQMMREKSKYDPDSVKRTLNILHQHPSPDHQYMAIEQLTYMEHPDISNQMVRWLVDQVHPSRLQFRALQALKQRGYGQDVLVRRQSGLHWVDLQTVPLKNQDWPVNVQRIGQLAFEKCADYFPSFEPLLQNFWFDFLQWVFLDEFYKQLSEVIDSDVTLWADALVREGFYAWTGSEAEQTEVTDSGKTSTLRQQLRPYFQPHGS